VPLKRENSLVHVGVNVSATLKPVPAGFGPGVATNVRLRERPEARVDGTRFVDTGNIDADQLVAYGAEFAAQHKNFFVQGEYFDITADRRVPNLISGDPKFEGWYVQGAWTITGEPRRYAIASATFDSPRPTKNFSLKDGGIGAWELAARYSTLDLNHDRGVVGGPLTTGAIRGGEQDIVTLGLNWYPNQTVRFMASYQDVSIDRLSPGGTFFGSAAGETPAAGTQVGQDFEIWSLRTQYAF
jgi:phosphate-selective porin OprO/OprP